MRAQDVIMTKRDGKRLPDEQIDWFVSHYAAGTDIADEQAAALVMAIFLNGMVSDELARWTGAMIDSGTRLDLSMLDRPTVDKHSTGGVGDKISLIVVPVLAACGAAVPQLSGRGLGHTGGTLDKMEAIPGWRADLSLDAIRRQLATIGGVIAGASASLAPADRKLYALRDVTGTVESIPLIASSIMSKKIAEGTDALTLDVKVGAGAFMKDFHHAGALARTMVELGQAHGVATSALVTRMDDVLGRTAGNALEVTEALDVLRGGGPPTWSRSRSRSRTTWCAWPDSMPTRPRRCPRARRSMPSWPWSRLRAATSLKRFLLHPRSTSFGPSGQRWSSASTRWRWAWRRGTWERAEPARKTS